MFGKRLFGLSLLLVLVTGLLFNVDVPARAQDDEPDEDAVELVVGFTAKSNYWTETLSSAV